MTLFKIISIFFLLLVEPSSAMAQEKLSQKFNLGSTPTALEITLWDTDVKPNGEGLPPGSGTAKQGESIFTAKCAMCHGVKGINGPYPQLAGRRPNDRFDFGIDHTIPRTVGNYWPYATSLFDYIWRAMPQIDPGSLTPTEVYSLSAYILYLNKIISKEEIMDAQSLPLVKMPSRDKFYIVKE